MKALAMASLCVLGSASLAWGQVAVEFLEGSGAVTGSGFPTPANYPTIPMARRGSSGGGSTGAGFSSISLSLADVTGGTNMVASGSSSHFSSIGGNTTSTVSAVMRLAGPARVKLRDLSSALIVSRSGDQGQVQARAGSVFLSPAESLGRLLGTLESGILLAGDYQVDANVWADANTFSFPNTRSSTLAWTLAMTPLTPQALASTDATSDGSDDVFFHHTPTGVCVAWTRVPRLDRQSFAILGGAPPNWEIRGSGDMSLDGIADVVWQNPDTREVGIWITRPGQLIEWRSLGVVPAGWRVEAVGDFDGDFQNDLIFRNSESGVILAWLMDATTLRTWQLIATIPTDWRIITAGDWTGDGKNDLLCHRAAGGEVGVLGMNNTQIISWSGIGFADPLRFAPIGRFDVDETGTQELLWQDVTTGRFVTWSIERRGTTAAFEAWAPFVNPLTDLSWRARN